MLENRAITINFTLAFLILSAFSCSTQQSFNFSEEEIWKLEEDYTLNYNNANHEGIIAVFHDDFLGWPDSEPQPVSKSDMKVLLEQNFPEPLNNQVEIERNGIQKADNVVIVYYTLHVTTQDDDGQEIKKLVRFTHTWMREKEDWKILGGMSY